MVDKTPTKGIKNKIYITCNPTGLNYFYKQYYEAENKRHTERGGTDKT